MDVITGAKLQDEVLMIVALSVFANKSALMMLHPSKRYMENTLSKMKTSGLISERDYESKKLIRLKTKAIELLKQNSETLYECYMRISSKNNPGMTPKHIELYKRISQVLVMMHLAGISIGVENPQLWQIKEGTARKNVLNKKGHAYTHCESADAARQAVNEMLSHAALDDIDVLTAEQESIQPAKAFLNQLDKTVPADTACMEMDDCCYLAVNLLTITSAFEEDVCQRKQLVFPVTQAEYDSILSASSESGYLSQALEEFIIQRVQKTMQSAIWWSTNVFFGCAFTWGAAIFSAVLTNALHTVHEYDVPQDIRNGTRGCYKQHTLIVNHHKNIAPRAVPIRWVGYNDDHDIVAELSATLDMKDGSIADDAFSAEIQDLIGPVITSARVYFPDKLQLRKNAVQEARRSSLRSNRRSPLTATVLVHRYTT